MGVGMVWVLLGLCGMSRYHEHKAFMLLSLMLISLGIQHVLVFLAQRSGAYEYLVWASSLAAVSAVMLALAVMVLCVSERPPSESS